MIVLINVGRETEFIHTGDEGTRSVKQTNEKLKGRTQLLPADTLVSHISCQLIVVKPCFADLLRLLRYKWIRGGISRKKAEFTNTLPVLKFRCSVA